MAKERDVGEEELEHDEKQERIDLGGHIKDAKDGGDSGGIGSNARLCDHREENAAEANAACRKRRGKADPAEGVRNSELDNGVADDKDGDEQEQRDRAASSLVRAAPVNPRRHVEVQVKNAAVHKGMGDQAVRYESNR